MTESIWMRARLRENSEKASPYRGARYYAESFSVLPSVVKRSPEEIDSIAREEFGPPVDPVKHDSRI